MVHSDEEALDNLLEGRGIDRAVHDRNLLGVARRFLLASALILAFAVAFWGSSMIVAARGQPAVVLPRPDFEQKASVGEAAAVEPSEALQRNEERSRMIVEQDLKTLLHLHVSQRQAHYRQSGKDDAQLCYQQAERLFDEVLSQSALDTELDEREMSAFKDRFALAMTEKCKDLISERLWIETAGKELEQQKPVMTAAVTASLNSAGLGFMTKMHDWLVHESVSSFEHHLGLLPTPEGQKSILKRGAKARQAGHLPDVFKADDKWPKCKQEILRIHNQGHCGSCWAFGGLASIDARMCIASGGKWDSAQDILSRLHVTSCAPDNYWQGHDGCQGGFPHWPMEMMAKAGVVSSSCLPYYIGGEGIEHFVEQTTAPPCETHCQNGYSLRIRNDTFSSAGVGNYDWLTQVHGDPGKIATMKTAIYDEGPVAFAFFANHPFMGYHNGVFSVCTGHDRANHAVYAYGWGCAASADGASCVEFVEASNSWGPNWGAEGHFRIAPRCITDVTIPGPIESTVVGHRIGTVDPSVPRDDDNEMWPWPKPDECPSDNDGCVTDMEGSGNYTDSEKCISHALDGKKIRVVEFDMEYGYDILYVSGQAFSGTEGGGLDLATLEGLRVDETGIKFQSDFSLDRKGFKICGDA